MFGRIQAKICLLAAIIGCFLGGLIVLSWDPKLKKNGDPLGPGEDLFGESDGLEDSPQSPNETLAKTANGEQLESQNGDTRKTAPLESSQGEPKLVRGPAR